MNDESRRPSGRRLSLSGLLLVIAVLAILFALLPPSISRWLDQSRRDRCMANLKLIGHGISAFHEARAEICPSYITDDNSAAALPNGYPAWPVLLLPYIEQKQLYNLVDLAVPLDRFAEAPADHARVAGTSLSTYLCPARPRSNGQLALGDYGCVALAEADPAGGYDRKQPRLWDAAMVPSRAFNASTAPNSNPINGFPSGTLGAREFRSMTSYASVFDGLSNTAFIGEKAVRYDRVNGGQPNLLESTEPSDQDGPLYFGRGGNLTDLVAPGAIAFWSRRLVPALSDERLLPSKPQQEDPNNRFGGWHEGVTLFLMGDGSVKAVRNDTDTRILQCLGGRIDRPSVGDLP